MITQTRWVYFRNTTEQKSGPRVLSLCHIVQHSPVETSLFFFFPLGKGQKQFFETKGSAEFTHFINNSKRFRGTTQCLSKMETP